MNEAEREALVLLAWLLVQHGRLEKAETLLSALAEVYPEDQKGPRLLADCFLRQGKYQKALDRLAGLCAEPDLSPAERRMAELLKAQALWGLTREDPPASAALKAELESSLAAYLKLTEETKGTSRTS